MHPDTAFWGILICGTLMILHCTVFWSPITNLSRLWFGVASDSPPWVLWARIIGVILAVFGFAVAGTYWWIR